MAKWFRKQSRLLQIILLLIPFVNWVTEVLVRWDDALKSKNNILKLVIAILVTLFGLVFGWVDVVWCLLFKHMILA